LDVAEGFAEETFFVVRRDDDRHAHEGKVSVKFQVPSSKFQTGMFRVWGFELAHRQSRALIPNSELGARKPNRNVKRET
jgi:hypothetical protein